MENEDIDLRLVGPLGCVFLTGSVIVTVFFSLMIQFKYSISKSGLLVLNSILFVFEKLCHSSKNSTKKLQTFKLFKQHEKRILKSKFVLRNFLYY